MAPVGQEAIRVGISQPLRSASCLICGGLRWIPRMAISEQCTAPHMFTQHAKATRSLAGRSCRVKCGCSSSIRALTMPEASVAAEWQWIQPCVCTTLLMELLVPPTGKPAFWSSSLSGGMLEIGRASCRERVEISGVAVSFKKKQQAKHVLPRRLHYVLPGVARLVQTP